jgi:SAM-dependent methyltransferase
MTNKTEIQKFYSNIQFPGPYTRESLSYYDIKIKNPYIFLINQHTGKGLKVLDIGCGTGLISNILALKNPKTNILGIDFSDSIHYAQWFANDQNITNVAFKKSDILDFNSAEKFDLIICQGVLHHIPELDACIKKIKSLLAPGGKLLLGVYHPWGKIIKKISKVNYKNHILYQDQECNPFEISFSPGQIRKLFTGFTVQYGYPAWAVAIRSFFNFRNGGLVLYVLTKEYDD